ncbi:Multidrug resistance protein MdtL [Pseudomonas fluorescens]|nr:Multidrug resistance protein MdtL [Pseudomonas fluorescens]
MRAIPVSILMLVSALGPFALGMMIAIQPEIGLTLEASPEQTQYALSSAFLVLGSCYLLTGKIIDGVGYRHVLLVSGGVFCISLYCGAAALNYESFVIARMLQAASGSCGFILVRAHLCLRFDDRQATTVLGYFTIVTAICPMLAPMIGHYVSTWLGWRGLYWGVAVLSSVMYLYIFLVGKKSFEDVGSTGRLGGVAHHYLAEINLRFVLSVLAISFASGVFYTFVTVGPFVMLAEFELDGKDFGVYFIATSLAFASASFCFSRTVTARPVEQFFGVGSLINATGLACMWVAIFYGSMSGLMIAILILNFGNGLLAPALSAYILIRVARSKPLASGLLGFAQMTSGGVISFMAGHFASGTLEAMGVLISFCVILSCLFAAGLMVALLKNSLAADRGSNKIGE